MKIDCWNTIGVVRGDRSCPELSRHSHCRHCPTYTMAAQALLDRELPVGAIEERTRYFAQPKPADRSETHSVVLFRIGSEWLGLPTAIVTEVADVRPIRTLPHRRGGAVLGVVNIRGELTACVSLARLLGAAAGPTNENSSRLALERLLVLRRGPVRAACPADEVHGIHHFDSAALAEIPATVGKAGSRHSKAVAQWNGRSVGVLDEQLLLQSVQRSLA